MYFPVFYVLNVLTFLQFFLQRFSTYGSIRDRATGSAVVVVGQTVSTASRGVAQSLRLLHVALGALNLRLQQLHVARPQHGAVAIHRLQQSAPVVDVRHRRRTGKPAPQHDAPHTTSGQTNRTRGRIAPSTKTAARKRFV